jgi:hypothetical protein
MRHAKSYLKSKLLFLGRTQFTGTSTSLHVSQSIRISYHTISHNTI